MWFGERAVAEDLKANLLSGAHHLVDDRAAEKLTSVLAS
jgi:hypothetical protein